MPSISHISGVDVSSLPTRNAITKQNISQQQLARTKNEELLLRQRITSVRCVTYDKSRSEEDLRSKNEVHLKEEETLRDDSTSNFTRTSSYKRALSLDRGQSASRTSPYMFSTSSRNIDSRHSGGEIGQLKFYSHNDGLMSISKQRQFDSQSQIAPYSRMSTESGEYKLFSIV